MPWGPPNPLCNGYRVSLPGAKRPRRGVNHPPLSSAKVKEKVELHLYSLSGPSWPLLGRNYLFTVCSLKVVERSGNVYEITFMFSARNFQCKNASLLLVFINEIKDEGKETLTCQTVTSLKFVSIAMCLLRGSLVPSGNITSTCKWLFVKRIV
jgi:hypothetical protein